MTPNHETPSLVVVYTTTDGRLDMRWFVRWLVRSCLVVFAKTQRSFYRVRLLTAPLGLFSRGKREYNSKQSNLFSPLTYVHNICPHETATALPTVKLARALRGAPRAP